MKINRYALKNGVTRRQLEQCGFVPGGSCLLKDAALYRSHFIADKYGRFSIRIVFKDAIDDWNDLDNVVVMEDDFGIRYNAFYRHDNDRKAFPTLRHVIEEYNSFMDAQPYLERIED